MDSPNGRSPGRGGAGPRQGVRIGALDAVLLSNFRKANSSVKKGFVQFHQLNR